MALSSISQEAVYLCMLAESLQVPRAVFEVFCNDRSSLAPPGSEDSPIWRTAIQIWSDSEAALAQAKKPDNWVVDKLRHIRTAYHFFKQYVRKGLLRFSSVSGKDNCADVYTKGFGAPGTTAANSRASLRVAWPVTAASGKARVAWSSFTATPVATINTLSPFVPASLADALSR